MKRMINWGQDNPNEQLLAYLASIKGDISNLQEGIGNPVATLRRMYAFVSQCQDLAKELPKGEWDKDDLR